MKGRPGTLRTLQELRERGRITATDLVTESLRRLESARELNVLALENGEAALAEAAHLDQTGATGSLWGVPTLIKDLEDVAGLPTRKGSLALRDVAPATDDGVTPGRLRAAGAIVVGKSTLPEFAIEGYTANLLTGVTRNPWNPTYSPGGSSGGSAAALSAGLVAVATATDGGGSVRIPASLCGLVGLKPTNGTVGRWPAHDWIDLSTDGPMATTVDDLRILFDCMRGPVAGDPSALPSFLSGSWPRHGERPLRIVAAERTSPLGPLDSGVEVAFRDAVEQFSDRFGAPVEWCDPASFFLGGNPDLDWFVTTASEHVAALTREWVDAHFNEFHVATQEFFQTGLDVTIDEYLATRRRRYHYARQLSELLGGDAVLLTPAVASEGFLADGRLRPDQDVHGLPASVISTAMQNITGVPAITVPMGNLTTGLPFGLQITAPHFHDYRLLDIAAECETAFPWPRTAPGYDVLEAAFQ